MVEAITAPLLAKFHAYSVSPWKSLTVKSARRVPRSAFTWWGPTFVRRAGGWRASSERIWPGTLHEQMLWMSSAWLTDARQDVLHACAPVQRRLWLHSGNTLREFCTTGLKQLRLEPWRVDKCKRTCNRRRFVGMLSVYSKRLGLPLLLSDFLCAFSLLLKHPRAGKPSAPEPNISS